MAFTQLLIDAVPTMIIILGNFVSELAGRLDGPLHFRFIVQPIMAAIFAFRDGRIDAKKNRDPYLWAILTKPRHRKFLVNNGWKGISKVFILACVLDLIYQLITERSLNIRQALIVACLLSLFPYTLLRGLTNRFIVMRRKKQ